MMNSPSKYTVTSTSDKSAEVTPMELSVSATGTHRLILKPSIVRESTSTPPVIKFSLVRQRRDAKQAWVDDVDENASAALKINEVNAMRLDSREVANLLQHLDKLRGLISETGFVFGEKEFVLAPEETTIQLDSASKAQALKQLLETNPAGVWEELVRTNSRLAHQLAINKINEERAAAVAEFEANLGNDDEEFWQQFFQRNTWIFGYALNFKWLHQYESKAYVGGKTPDNTGGNLADFVLNSFAEAKFTLCVEIKTPATELLTYAAGKDGRVPKTYRNNVSLLSPDLLGGATQTQTYCEKFTISAATQPEYAEQLREDGLHTVSPKGILIIGRLSELNGNKNAIRTFHNFRQNLNNPEIVTFDELLQRAKAIVLSDTPTEAPVEDFRVSQRSQAAGPARPTPQASEAAVRPAARRNPWSPR